MAAQTLLPVLLEVILAFIIVPWCAWVTTSIFGLRTQTALMQEQLKAVKNIESLVVAQLGSKNGQRSQNPAN